MFILIAILVANMVRVVAHILTTLAIALVAQMVKYFPERDLVLIFKSQHIPQ